ncbi:MAG: SH3 domain-containing protein [Oscillospiraceae bacterium]|jgi:uncharacterized protein YgiM (DUF1202 family)|nr:SH3 domain-containing protein [Oscillospiraceae bacterium]
MKRITVILLILCIITAGFGTLLPAAFAASQTAIVNNPNPADRLHLRSAPSASAASLGKYYNGVQVTVLSYQNSVWSQVRIGSGDGSATGYMMTRYLKTGGSVASTIPTMYVKTSGGSLNLRASRSSASKAIASLRNGASVQLLCEASPWVQVRTSSGKIGFVMRSYLTADSGGMGGSSSGDNIQNGSIGWVNNGNGKRLHLRSGAGSGYSSLGLYYTGTPVTALAAPSNGWARVRIGNSGEGTQTGYMMLDFLTFRSTDASLRYTLPTYRPRAASAWDLKMSPSIIADPVPLSDFSDSNTLFLMGELSGGWWHMQNTYSGKTGFVNNISGYVKVK